MSWKSFACVAALSALITSPALAMPSLSWVDNTGSATLQLTPSGTGSVAVEIEIDYDGGALSNASIGADFDTPNPGNNTITLTETTGLYDTDEATGDYFLSFGSVVFGAATPVDLITFDYAGSGDLTLPSIVVAEGGSLVSVSDPGPFSVGAAPGLPGDANGDGVVNGADINPFILALGDFAAWEAANSPPATLIGVDVNNDGLVNGADINPFIAALSGPATASAVPEPSTMLIAAIGLAGFAVRRRS